jgi:hypothetical protein
MCTNLAINVQPIELALLLVPYRCFAQEVVAFELLRGGKLHRLHVVSSTKSHNLVLLLGCLVCNSYIFSGGVVRLCVSCAKNIESAWCLCVGNVGTCGAGMVQLGSRKWFVV